MAHLRTDMTNAEYRAVKAWSKSDLDYLSMSAALIEWNRDSPSGGSDSVDLGTHVHCSLLEPERYAKQYVKAPEFNMRTADGRAQSEIFFEKAARAGKIALDARTSDAVSAMTGSVMAHPTARNLLTGEGVSEASIFWELDGMKLKCRPDRIAVRNNQHFLIDVKKTADIDTFWRSVDDFRYHVQAAYYLDAFRQLADQDAIFVFVVVGERMSIGRHPVRTWVLPKIKINEGREIYLENLERAREYDDFGLHGLELEELNHRYWNGGN